MRVENNEIKIPRMHDISRSVLDTVLGIVLFIFLCGAFSYLIIDWLIK